MRRGRSIRPLVYFDSNLLSVFCCFLIITAMWLGVYLDSGSVVLAESVKQGTAVVFNGAIASQPNVMNDLKNQVKGDLNDKSKHAGDPRFINQTIEKTRSVTAKTKSSFDCLTKRTEITDDAVNRQKKENVAKIQGKAVNLGHEVESAIDGMSNLRSKLN